MSRLSFFTCPDCEGYGAIVIGHGYFSDGSENNEERPCPECEGTGRVIKMAEPLTAEEAAELDEEALCALMADLEERG